MASYHDALHAFPLNMTSGGGADGQGGCRTGSFSWRAQLLPFVEEKPLYDAIRFDVTMADRCNDPLDGRISASHPNARAAARRLPVFLCPSDGDIEANDIVMGSANPGPDNYAANAGWPSFATGFDGERAYPSKYNGVITLAAALPGANVAWHPRRGIRAKDISDGLSHTAAVAERLIQRGNTLAEIRGSDTRVQSFHLTDAVRTLPQMIAASQLNPHADATYSAYQGRSWISGWTLAAPTYMHVFPPNNLNMHLHSGVSSGDNLVTPSSHHTDGVNLLMCDGHVTFVSDDVEPRVWWAMGSRNDGRVMQENHE
jgi:prepilin-type processing-associated H-X9-DG protein